MSISFPTAILAPIDVRPSPASDRTSPPPLPSQRATSFADELSAAAALTSDASRTAVAPADGQGADVAGHGCCGARR